MFCYKQVATYDKEPAPDVSFKRLRDKMAMTTPTVDRTNAIDYTGRYPSQELFDGIQAFRGALNLNTNTSNWYISEVAVQPIKWGWTAWNNSHLKKRKFIRFIYNKGPGVTHWVDNGVRKQIPDRNTGDSPRFVFEVSIPSKNINEWEKAKEIFRNAQ